MHTNQETVTGNRPRHAAVSPNAKIVTISPRDAKVLLERNANIRELRPTLVAQYAREMANGRWKLNGETVKVDPDGWLVDGQHRLHACIEADTAFVTFIVYDATADGVDEGRARSFHDLIGGKGIIGKTIAGSMVRSLYLLEQGQDPWQRSEKVGNQALMEFYEAMPQARFDRARALGVACQRPIPGTTVGIVAYQVGASDEGAELVDVFFTGMSKGVDLQEGSPQIKLVRWMDSIRRESRQGSIWRRAIYVATCRAWNAYVIGKPLSGHSQGLYNKIHDAPLPKLLTK